MSWLDALLGRILNSGVSVPLALGLNFTSGLRARLNQSTKVIDLDVNPNTLTPEMMAPEAANRSVPFILHSTFTFTAAAADLALVVNAPFAFKILRVSMTLEQGHSASLQLRGAVGGTGTQYSTATSSGSANALKTSLAKVPLLTVAAGNSVYLHTDGAGAENGDVFLDCIRV